MVLNTLKYIKRIDFTLCSYHETHTNTKEQFWRLWICLVLTLTVVTLYAYVQIHQNAYIK